MKPTIETSRPSRHINSPRPQGVAISKTPATDWSFQAGAELRGTATSTGPVTETVARTTGLYAATQGFFEANTRWEDRIEAIGLAVVIALATWPIMQAVHTAMDTV